ncbi:antileukoproteinase-like [Mirounga leonina]|uniref:antileukoproteinase-like n=1 Tax=Mirounga leonina TaxID=9715 RepID=UPI00156C561D|nr:antileukoproteinase-like [Mirounga leonina]
MKPGSLITFTVLLALQILTSRTVEGASKEKAKHGVCPFRPHVMCIVFEPPQCQSDWQCPKEQKCCNDYCGIKCMDPVDPAKPVNVNPGKCPVVTGQCRRPNPTDICLNDGHCPNSLKCCKGVCGNSCVKPVKGKIWLRSTSPVWCPAMRRRVLSISLCTTGPPSRRSTAP